MANNGRSYGHGLTSKTASLISERSEHREAIFTSKCFPSRESFKLSNLCFMRYILRLQQLNSTGILESRAV